MGGTLKKLHDQGHDVHVAYMTSGANGVSYLEAKKYMYFLKDFSVNYLWNNNNFTEGGKFIS
jgi:glucosamine-6-phosphate deaminase